MWAFGGAVKGRYLHFFVPKDNTYEHVYLAFGAVGEALNVLLAARRVIELLSPYLQVKRTIRCPSGRLLELFYRNDSVSSG